MLLSISKGSKNIAAQTPREKLPPTKKGGVVTVLLNDRVFTNVWGGGGLDPCGVGFVGFRFGVGESPSRRCVCSNCAATLFFWAMPYKVGRTQELRGSDEVLR